MSGTLPTLSRKSSAFNFKAMGGSQMQGFLLKQPVGHKSTAWTRRYFVLKEGFLLYYAEAEKKTFEAKSTFNIHPKGVIPLGYCAIKDATFPNVSYGINVVFPDGTNAINLGAEDRDSQAQWLKAMDIASRITLENCNLGETMIRSLQEHTLQLTREKQEYYYKFMEQAEEIGTERNQRVALEEFNQQLADEKRSIEKLVGKLQKALDQVTQQLQENTKVCETLEEDKNKMKKSTKKLEESIKEITNERNDIIKRLRDEDAKQSKNEEITSDLRNQLNEITKTAKSLELERVQMEAKLNETEEKWENFSKEKDKIEANAEELKQEIVELNKDKLNAKAELEEEIAAKLKLQDELKLCKSALERLEKEAIESTEKLKSFGVISPSYNQVYTDVKSLREFFENLEMSVDSKSVPTIASNRSFSRRYTQIKKMRHCQTAKKSLTPNLVENASTKDSKEPVSEL